METNILMTEQQIANRRTAISLLKQDIKILAEEQKNIKTQRKTVYCNVERTVEPRKAVMLIIDNRIKLTQLYIAYLKLRNKDVALTYPNHTSMWSSKTDKLVDLYLGKAVAV